MKSVATRPGHRKKINLNSATFTVSHAKTYLGRLIEKAGNGEMVYIVRGQRRFLLQEIPPIDPIPIRPPGYFANVYSHDEIAEQNALAKSSIRRVPKDLE